MSKIQKITNMMQATVKRTNVGNPSWGEGGGGWGYSYMKRSSRVQVKDSGLT